MDTKPYKIEIEFFVPGVLHWKVRHPDIPGGLQLGHAGSLDFAFTQVKEQVTKTPPLSEVDGLEAILRWAHEKDRGLGFNFQQYVTSIRSDSRHPINKTANEFHRLVAQLQASPL